MRRIASARCGAFGATSRNFLYASIACVSLAVTRASLSTCTVRPASVFSVGSLSGVPPLLAQPPSSAALSAPAASRLACSSVRLWLRGILRILFWRVARGRVFTPLLAVRAAVVAGIGPVVKLREREARLRRISGQAFLLAAELGHGDVLHRALLLLRKPRDARQHRGDQRVQRRDALAERREARRLVLLRLRERGIEALRLGDLRVDGGQVLLRVPQPSALVLRQVPGQRAGGQPHAVGELGDLGIVRVRLDRLLHALDALQLVDLLLVCERAAVARGLAGCHVGG